MSRPVQNKARNEVIIRPPQPDDWEAYVSAVKRSGALHRPWISPKARNRKEFTDFLDRCSADNYFGYLVIHRSSGALVGSVSIFDVVRRNLQSGMLGYFVFVPFAGQGLMSQGLRLLLRQAFSKLKLHRLEAQIQPANHASITLIRRLGFTSEGLSRRIVKIRGQWKDHERWALLVEDFRAGRSARKIVERMHGLV